MSLIKEFKSLINGSNPIEFIRSGLIGDGIEIKGPFGRTRLIYADYVASGRALDQVEDFIRHQVCHIMPIATPRPPTVALL